MDKRAREEVIVKPGPRLATFFRLADFVKAKPSFFTGFSSSRTLFL